jgi:ubiquinone/menaquinone biosynthesis C-methylase UbiE
MAAITARIGHAYDRVFAAAYDPILASVERAGLGEARALLLAGARGRTLEIGAGTGANVRHMPSTVTELILTEPAPAMRERLERRVSDALGSSSPGGSTGQIPVAVRVLSGTATGLPVEDASIDTLVSTLVLCSVPDLDAAVQELRRVITPDGVLLVMEHVAGHGRTRRAQRIIDPVWRVVARGCRLVRETRDALEQGGFDTSDVRDWSLPGGGVTGPALLGTARPR